MKVKKYFFEKLIQRTNEATQKFYSGVLFWLNYPQVWSLWTFLTLVVANYMSICIQYHRIS